MLSPEERRHRARVAAYARWARHDPAPTMARARDAQWAGYEREVDPDNTLSPQERQRRAIARQRELLARMSLASAKARRERRAK